MYNLPKKEYEALKAKQARGERMHWSENMKINEYEIAQIAISLRAKRKGY